GWVLYRLGRHDEALVQLRRAHSLQKDAEIAAHVAEVLWTGGEREEARRYFREALELDPDNRALRGARERSGARLMEDTPRLCATPASSSACRCWPVAPPRSPWPSCRRNHTRPRFGTRPRATGCWRAWRTVRCPVALR